MAPAICRWCLDGGNGVSVAGDHACVAAGQAGLHVLPAQCRWQEWRRIDIVPGNEANRVDCKESGGIVPVAILTTAEHDALDIDHTSVRFGPAGAREAERDGEWMQRREVDVDEDGDLDLLLHFIFEEAGIECGDTEAAIIGRSFLGMDIGGRDRISTNRPWDNREGWEAEALAAVWNDLDGRECGVGCYPNPFNPSTSIVFALPEARYVRLAVYSIDGRLVTTLVDEVKGQGAHEVEWHGRDTADRCVPSGVYFYRFAAGDYVETKRMTLLK